LNIYEKASGAKMNLDKTVGMYLGKWWNKNPRFRNSNGCRQGLRLQYV
jgi:hypothetical protein